MFKIKCPCCGAKLDLEFVRIKPHAKQDEKGQLVEKPRIVEASLKKAKKK